MGDVVGFKGGWVGEVVGPQGWVGGGGGWPSRVGGRGGGGLPNETYQFSTAL